MGAPEDERKITVRHPPPYRRSFEGEDSREIDWSISGYGLALPFSLSLSPSFWLDVDGEALGSRSVVDENVCHEDEFNGVAMWSFLVGCNRLIAIITTMKTFPSNSGRKIPSLTHFLLSCLMGKLAFSIMFQKFICCKTLKSEKIRILRPKLKIFS